MFQRIFAAFLKAFVNELRKIRGGAQKSYPQAAVQLVDNPCQGDTLVIVIKTTQQTQG